MTTVTIPTATATATADTAPRIGFATRYRGLLLGLLSIALFLAAWEAVFHDTDYFNQLNCALHQDSSTWVVPGSHLRPDLPREHAAFPARPIPSPAFEGTNEERERACLEYCRSMPGAVCLHLDAGDFALYRNTLWHLGSYVPYARRATLHDVVDTPEFIAWRERV